MTDGMTAFIFARGGSKGLPGKNIKPLAGKPMIAWAIEQALAVSQIGRVIVSTDDVDVSNVAQMYGAQVPFMRPAYLASDTASEWDAWRHALEIMREMEGALPDPFISVPATSPLREPEDIQQGLALYEQGDCDAVVAVTAAHRNPWFNMVKMGERDYIELVNKSGLNVARRQDTPVVFDMTTCVYVASPQYILEKDGLFSGRVKASQIPIDRAIDIDTPYDFEIANFLMERKLSSK